MEEQAVKRTLKFKGTIEYDDEEESPADVVSRLNGECDIYNIEVLEDKENE